MEQEKTETKINGGLLLREYAGGIRFGTDALLLADYAKKKIHAGRCADFGSGSGVLPMLLLASGSKCSFSAVEIQKKYADLILENAELNGLGSSIEAIHGDLREYRTLFASGSMSYIISNPPYLTTGSGKQNLAEEKKIAWHEECLTVEELAAAVGWTLKSGGSFFCVFLPERMASLIAALKRNALEPKRIRFVCPSLSESPSLLLLEAKKNAGEGLIVEPNLALYTDLTHQKETEELQIIYSEFGVT